MAEGRGWRVEGGGLRVEGGGFTRTRRPALPLPGRGSSVRVQGYLTEKKTYLPRTLLQGYAWGLKGVLGGWAFSYGRGTPV